MRNKIFTILGILIVIVAIGAYLLFDANVKNNSQTMGVNVLIAKDNIPEGTVIKNINDAQRYFGVKKMSKSETVPSYSEVRVVNAKSDNIIDNIKGFFVPTNIQITAEDLKGLVNKKVTRTFYKNEQIIGSFLSDDTTEFREGERYFAVPTTYMDSVGAEITKSDYVDLWIHYGDKHPKAGQSERIGEALKVIKIKDANNVEIKETGKEIPKLVIFKLDEDSIKKLSEKSYEGSLFLTKWGVSPSSSIKATIKESTDTESTTQQPATTTGVAPTTPPVANARETK